MSKSPEGSIILRKAVTPVAMVLLICSISGCGFFGGSSGQTPGTILFGSGAQRVSAYQWAVKKPGTVFRDGKFMGWVAQLQKPLHSSVVTIVLKDAKTGQTVWQGEKTGLNPKFVQLANNVPVDSFVKAGTGASVPGRYTLEYLSGSTVLAQGSFKIIK